MSDTPRFAPYTPEFARDPYAVYARMRESRPIHYHPPWDTWVLFRYEDIKTLLTDARLGRVMDEVLTEDELAEYRRRLGWDEAPLHSRYVKISIIDSEGTLHERLRKAVFKVFTPRAVEQLQPYVQSLVDQQVGHVEAMGRFDFVEDFVAPIPGLVIGRMLGVPEADCPQLRRWSEDIVQFFEPERTAAHRELAEGATGEFVDYLDRLVAERRRRPGEDLLSAMLDWEDGGERLSHDELLSTAMTILMAGHGSTIDAAGNGMLALLRSPEQMAALREDPGLTGTAVQEMFRYEPPLPYFHRYVLEDLTYEGQSFEKGDTLGFCYASANRDSAQFAEPDRFDIRRSPNRHLAFGGGVHHCLGNHLARMNMSAMFTTLLRRLPRLRAAVPLEAVQYRLSFTSRGLEALPLACD